MTTGTEPHVATDSRVGLNALLGRESCDGCPNTVAAAQALRLACFAIQEAERAMQHVVIGPPAIGPLSDEFVRCKRALSRLHSFVIGDAEYEKHVHLND